MLSFADVVWSYRFNVDVLFSVSELILKRTDYFTRN